MPLAGIIPQMEDMMDWISVKDRLPEIYERVIYYVPGWGIYYGNRQEDDTWDAPDVFGPPWLSESVTHWMPLPEPPK